MTNKNFIFSVLLIFTTLMLVGYQTNNFVKVWGKYSATEDRMVSVTSDGKVNINGSVSVSGATMPSTETSTPVEYNVPCTSADTEYSQSFSNAKSIFFQNRDNSDLRYSFTSGRVASSYPYTTLKAGCSYYSDDLDMASGTIYFAHGVGGITVEMVVGQ